MNTFRTVALALVACAGVLSVTACSAGLTTASSASSASSAGSAGSAATSPATTGHSASASSASAAPSASSVAISGRPFSFPVPVGAKVAYNVVLTGDVIVFFSGITPEKVLAFYTKALPQAGYTITGSEMASTAGGTAVIMFTGHGFKGQVAAVTDFSAAPGTPGGNVTGLPHKNVSTIELFPQ